MFDLFLAYSDFGRHAFADLEGEVLFIRGPVNTVFCSFLLYKQKKQ